MQYFFLSTLSVFPFSTHVSVPVRCSIYGRPLLAYNSELMNEDIVFMHRFSFALFLIDTGSHAHFFLLYFLSLWHKLWDDQLLITTRSSFHAIQSFSANVHKLECCHGMEGEHNNEYTFQNVVAQKWQKLSACFSHIYFYSFIRVRFGSTQSVKKTWVGVSPVLLFFGWGVRAPKKWSSSWAFRNVWLANLRLQWWSVCVECFSREKWSTQIQAQKCQLCELLLLFDSLVSVAFKIFIATIYPSHE